MLSEYATYFSIIWKSRKQIHDKSDLKWARILQQLDKISL